MPRPPETTILAAVSSGRSDLASSSPTKPKCRRRAQRQRLQQQPNHLRRQRVEAGGTHGDDLDRSARLHGGDGVTGVDRALEGVGAFDRDDLGDLVNVQQRGNARQDVLAVGGGGASTWL
jgi:hypothetical protein